ncbi:MAG: flippase [Nitrospirae bacterium]|nr:flippase [Nitrospirota bacterium]
MTDKGDSKARRVIKNTAWLFSASLLAKLVSLALMIVIARGLGDSAFGWFTLALSVSQIFIISADLGVTFLSMRDIARDRTIIARYLGGFAVLKFALSAASLIAVVAAANILGYPTEVRRIIYILYAYLILASLAGLLRSAFLGSELMLYDAALTLAERLAVVVPALGALWLGYGVHGVAVSYLIGGAVNLVASLYLVGTRFGWPRFHVDWDFWLASLREAYPFALVGVFSMLFLYVDTVILEQYRGEREVGLYSAAFGLIHHLRVVPSAFLGAAFPVMARAFGGGSGSSGRIYAKSFKMVLALGVPLSAGGFMLAPDIIRLIYGEGFMGAAAPFRVLIVSAWVFYLNGLFGYFLLSLDRQKANLVMIIIATALNIVLNFALVPSHGYMGAAWATLLSELAVFVMSLAVIHRCGYGYLPWGPAARSLAASGVMAAFLSLPGVINVAVLVAGGACVYFLALTAFRFFDAEDRGLLREVLGR